MNISSLASTISFSIGFIAIAIMFCFELRWNMAQCMIPIDKKDAHPSQRGTDPNPTSKTKYKLSFENVQWNDAKFITSLFTLVTIVLYMFLQMFGLVQRSAELANGKLSTPLQCGQYIKLATGIYQFCKGSVYNVLILRLEMAYHKTPFRYSNRTMYSLRILLCIFLFGSIFVSMWMPHGELNDGYCELSFEFWGVIYIMFWDLFFTMVTLILFNLPLRKLIHRSHSILTKPTMANHITQTSSEAITVTTIGDSNTTNADKDSTKDGTDAGADVDDVDDDVITPTEVLLQPLALTVIGGAAPPSAVRAPSLSIPAKNHSMSAKPDNKIGNLAVKYTVLSSITVTTTFLFIVINRALKEYFLFMAFADYVVNILCLILMRVEYSKCYDVLCWAPDRLWKKCCGLN